MIIYIAGKITGDDNYRAKFAAVAELLTADGHIVLNPAVLPEGMSHADYMRINMAMIDTADGVALLPDWEDSPGARLEHEYCGYIGKPCAEMYTGDDANV